MQFGNRPIIRVLAQMGFENAQYDLPHFRFGGGLVGTCFPKVTLRKASYCKALWGARYRNPLKYQ